jgi:hypothetical protein
MKAGVLFSPISILERQIFSCEDMRVGIPGVLSKFSIEFFPKMQLYSLL